MLPPSSATGLGRSPSTSQAIRIASGATRYRLLAARPAGSRESTNAHARYAAAAPGKSQVDTGRGALHVGVSDRLPEFSREWQQADRAQPDSIAGGPPTDPNGTPSAMEGGGHSGCDPGLHRRVCPSGGTGSRHAAAVAGAPGGQAGRRRRPDQVRLRSPRLRDQENLAAGLPSLQRRVCFCGLGQRIAPIDPDFERAFGDPAKEIVGPGQ
jgi:hypothetical protein